jgi:hypothetical protein
LNVVNSFAAAWMQLSTADGVVGILIKLDGLVSNEIALRYDSTPKLTDIMMLFNPAGELTEMGFTAEGYGYELLRGLCLDDDTCRYPGAVCWGGLCFDPWGK